MDEGKLNNNALISKHNHTKTKRRNMLRTNYNYTCASLTYAKRKPDSLTSSSLRRGYVQNQRSYGLTKHIKLKQFQLNVLNNI